MDGKDVQEESVLEGQASSESTSEAPQPQPLTKADLEALMESLDGKLNERDKRLKQSFDDKLKAQRPQTSQMGQIPEDLLKDADPEVQARFYQDYIRKQQAEQVKAQQAAQQRAAYEKVVNEWSEDNTEFLVELGLDPADKRLEWGNPETESLGARQKKLHASAAKVLKAEREASTKQAKKQADDDVAKAAREAGLESNAAVGGSASEDDKSWYQRWADGDVAPTPENIARAEKILNSRT